ncbi:MAG: PG0870-related protein, partial [Bacteroidales bacterium]
MLPHVTDFLLFYYILQTTNYKLPSTIYILQTMHYLQKYKGKSTRHTCPACETIHSFTLYLNGDTHEPIHRTVGICNRETKCGYHYTPKQYFMDNPDTQKCSQHFSNTTNVEIRSTPSPSGRAGVGSISFSYVQKSASYKSYFIRFLCEFLTVKQMIQVG